MGYLPPQVLDGRLVAPTDVVDGDGQHRGDGLTIGGAGGPAAHDDGLHAIMIQAASLDQFVKADSLFST